MITGIIAAALQVANPATAAIPDLSGYMTRADAAAATAAMQSDIDRRALTTAIPPNRFIPGSFTVDTLPTPSAANVN